ncbi:elongation factor P [Candidatus Falkowbacteria bacterium RIFOXYC2_FULL_47_12]|uniref:Elongation factor P n=2 Tax=Candidatus Falkowiibacteriota TaxID=1752728 RepID=A0A1F5TQH8_9BACT|nr:MAG: elongation factor P [Candidatus Falkowbacteria bacterium RIFOXYA2_FULL_47_9]OGF41118.1 MAG: elongation factor P [Candidatus Falkowbacteria bacterium RIFOXYC2_FULL_47_12]
MLSLNEIKLDKLLKINSEPYIVIRADHHKMGRGGAVLKTKLRNVITGNVLEHTFQGNDKADEAETDEKQAQYLYKDANEAYFMDNVTFEQFSLPLEQVGASINWLKDGTDVKVLYFDEKPVAVKLPVKVELKVVSAPPGVKGNSAGNVNKIVTLETGVEIAAPMFINEGDVVRINTETGEYAERA